MTSFTKYLRLIAIGAALTAIECQAYITHEVKRSETLWGISHKYNVSADDIVAANPQAENGLKTGMVLRIPEKADIDALHSVQQPAQEAPAPVAEDTPTAATPQPAPADVPQPDDQDDDELFVDNSDITYRQTVVDGKAYRSRFGDTLGSIARKTGVDYDTLVECNPLIDAYTQIPEGTIVRLAKDAPYATAKRQMTLVDSIVYHVAPARDAMANQLADPTVVVMMPFDLDHEVINRQSMLATDFYKGFLLAVKQATEYSRQPLRIMAVDTQCDADQLDKRLEQLKSENVTVIIPPDDDAQLAKIEQFALDSNILVLNVLNIKDEGYVDYPNVVQANITQKQMYDKAVGALLSIYKDYTPVILDLSGGRDEKAGFIEELRKRYDAAGRKVINLSFKNRLTDAELSTLPSNGKYIFIPKSGSADVFGKFHEALTELMYTDATGQKYKLFGYPDWVTLRGEHEEALHRMNATIYSRFYLDMDNLDASKINNEFVRWYGADMEEVYPSQGILGYDTGMLLVNKIKNSPDGNVMRLFNGGTHFGVQSAFHFVSEPGSSGLVNDSLYLIEFLPGDSSYVKTL